jgi:hypothetical protein
VLKKHKTQKNKEKDKKMSFGEINGEKNAICYVIMSYAIFYQLHRFFRLNIRSSYI